ncbi:F0F1 ATP synthase subunit epsilon [Clostridium estertheticum]|uniref:ATP synthase epsilon chain n=1 Tax=Clostridium estertheticum subsp. estertheticum TaxID=1552 RepID=A0A1J0GBQ8_9CLOT|nr:F0F1 ATP synthase subunit epsilon [Clostridium estertheticum]APC38789.1 ATP synthase F1 subunit epsilon [Clostridium estertheticum subsp. estertheticum]MBU3171400.1 F0F1 ATP synthase subunit epsilon [Clostridium estertheticum]MBU3185611.1 F0F1 ATP synthase subunit epsilon [Clostridium estertheticum]MBZ9615351.1 F0F1 ATP synthase subunit epsilon [Clostridium estertheticum subsp. laramiense]WAG75240.1 F0F1 ATP synthase subunit epsilon [Clostridium estertheticum]
MKNHIKLTMITPEKQFYSGDILSLNSQSDEGVFGILANHVPMISQLKPTVTTFIQVDGKELKAFTSTGVLRVLKGEVEMLCSACEWPEDIDIERANEAKKRAEKRLNTDDEVSLKRAESAVLRSVMRLKTKG